MQKYINLISYFGGKYPHLKWLISKLPAGNFHFVDIMCGSANVALNVDYPLITVNDINDEVINLFRILRDQHDEFMRLVYFTPFSRTELNKIIDDALAGIEFSDLERARRYFVKSQLGYGANGSQNNHYGTGFEYTIQQTKYYRVDNWNLKLKKMAMITDKLRGFQIESRNALDLFDSVNHKGTIVYWDPPYIRSVRNDKKRYKHEVDDDFHRTLSEKLRDAKCFVVVSGYDSPLYDEIFGWLHKTADKAKRSNVGKRYSTECVWTNYDPDIINGNYKMKF